MEIPGGHQTIMPYLIIKNAVKFIDFCTNVFGAKETFRTSRDGSDVIMHAEVNIGGSTVMIAEATGQWTTQTAGLFIYVDNADDRFKKAVDAGSEILMKPADQDYGRSSGVKDPFGVTWWITSV